MPQFTLRDMLWATAIVAAWAAWFGLLAAGHYDAPNLSIDRASLIFLAGCGTALGANIGGCFHRAMLGATLATVFLIVFFSLCLTIIGCQSHSLS